MKEAVSKFPGIFCYDLWGPLWLNSKSTNPAYRQAGTRDHEVLHKVTKGESIQNLSFDTASFLFLV